jgi:hypothetical protein
MYVYVYVYVYVCVEGDGMHLSLFKITAVPGNESVLEEVCVRGRWYASESVQNHGCARQ